MNSLHERFQDLFINREKWDYYCTGTSSCTEYPKDHCAASKFIKEFFLSGGKGKALNHKELLDKSSNCIAIPRPEHVVSAFFLGVLIYNHCKRIRTAINKKIKDIKCKGEKEKERKLFLYMWFLSCLYHDMGYVYEENIQKNNSEEDKPDAKLDYVLNQLKLNLNEYQHQKRGRSNELKTGIPNQLFGNIKTYYDKRKSGEIGSCKNKGVIDHGIIGGAMLFNAMADLHDYDDIKQDGGLLIGKPILEHYIAPAACAIMAHNMWHIEKNHPDEEKYRRVLLHDLIYTPPQRIINLDEHPLLFLLCLVDTIEPVKKNKNTNISTTQFLKDVSIEFSNDNIILFYNSEYCGNVNDLGFLTDSYQIVTIQIPPPKNQQSNMACEKPEART